MAKEICEESEVLPVRYEYTGLFGNKKILIVTTEDNMDEYSKVCSRRVTPSFWSISDNIKYITESVEK